MRAIFTFEASVDEEDGRLKRHFSFEGFSKVEIFGLLEELKLTIHEEYKKFEQNQPGSISSHTAGDNPPETFE